MRSWAATDGLALVARAGRRRRHRGRHPHLHVAGAHRAAAAGVHRHMGDRARRLPDRRRDQAAQGNRQRVDADPERRAVGAVRPGAAGRARRGRGRADLGDRRLRDRVRRAAGDAVVQAEASTPRHEIRTVRQRAGAARRHGPRLRRRAFATSSTTMSRPRRSATTSTFVVEHHFTGFGQVSASLNLLTWVAARTSTLRLGTAVHGAALAQSGAARRAGRDHRSAVRRPARIRRRQGLSRQRVRGLLHSDRRGRGALRGVARA